MNPLLQILQQALVDNLLLKKSEIVQRGVIGIIAIALTAALSFIALFFITLAFYSWMTLYALPHIAALVTAGAALLVCLMVGAITYLLIKPKPKDQSPPDDVSEMASVITAIAHKELGKSVESNPKTTLLLAGIAGLVAGKYLE